MIDRTFAKAATFALAGAVMTFFGFMHSEAIGIARTPSVAMAYLGVAAILYGCAKLGKATVREPLTDEQHGEPMATSH